MPMFTQKHYVAIAKVIHARRVLVKTHNVHRDGEPDAITEVALNAINEITDDLVKLFKDDNPKFRDLIFVEACNQDMLDAYATAR